MASVLLAIVVGLAALGNYMLFSVLPQGFVQWLSVIGQAVLSIFAVIVFFTYQGRKETSVMKVTVFGQLRVSLRG